VIVIVADTENPTAVLAAPRSVASATSFNLDGSRSFDAGGGRVVTYLWTYLGSALSTPTGADAMTTFVRGRTVRTATRRWWSTPAWPSAPTASSSWW
jgi:hypothetical protein